jgi:YHS domain-containing protein
MDLAESQAQAAGRVTEYGGKTYYFCSQHCKQQFDKNPGGYVGKTGR